MNKLFSPTPFFMTAGLVVIRILTGLLMAYHGLEVFDASKIESYAGWDAIKNMPFPLLMAYLGKGLELFTGLCFVFGIFTRLAALLMAVNMLVICFKVGTGKFWYDDQHPFLFAVLAMVFFFTGPVGFSLDKLWFDKTTTDQPSAM